MHQSLHDAWWHLATQRNPSTLPDALACGLLQVGSIAYRAVVAARTLGYERGWIRSVRLPVPVISVGNLTVGGTGKTTCVELLARKLTAAGRRVAVLSRGYGGARTTYQLGWGGGGLLVDGAPAPDTGGLADEPQLLARQLEGIPIVVGRRRDETGRLACERLGADTLLLDDGFQHRGLQRDCDIVLIHARTPFSGWPLLPRGPMREPMAALARAHIAIITKADEALNAVGGLSEHLRSFNPELLLVTAVHELSGMRDALTGARVDLSAMPGKRLGLLSSIGDPEGFASSVHRLHATALWHESFPDHHPYQPADWQRILARARGVKPDAVVTTEKDWIRLQRVLGHPPESAIPIWVLGVRMKLLSGEAELDARLARVCAR